MDDVLNKYTMILVIAGQHGYTWEQIISHDRCDKIVKCRRDIAEYLRDAEKLSYPAIGKIMHRDHSSIMHLLNPEKRREKMLNYTRWKKSQL